MFLKFENNINLFKGKNSYEVPGIYPLILVGETLFSEMKVLFYKKCVSDANYDYKLSLYNQ